MEWLIPEWLVALSLTLFVLDIFFMTEVLSWAGVLSLSAWLTWRIDVPFKWMILVFIASFIGFAFLYWFCFRNTVGTIVRRILQGKSPKESLYALEGAKGRIKCISNKMFLDVEGELWPVAPGSANVGDGAIVRVTMVKNGAAVVVPAAQE